jgi:hypothetical protein
MGNILKKVTSTSSASAAESNILGEGEFWGAKVKCWIDMDAVFVLRNQGGGQR